MKYSKTVVDVTEERVMKKLENLNVSKAPGPDGISPRLLKECKHELVTPLTQIFKKSLSEGKVIDVWKKAVVTPLYKKGRKSSVDSYRPVSLTSVPCKILESIIKDQLVEYLQKHSIIAPSQHGFTSGRSCLTNLTEFLEFVTNQLDHKTPVDAIYLDFSKAFDKVPHKRLLLKLKGIGIKGQLLEWISDWLSNRSQQVQVKGSLSDWAMVKSGVPQGSVLGPILFLIYVNDIDEKVTCNISKFADDTKIYASVPDREAARVMQNDLNKMYEWCKDWQMEFNVGKCKVMHFGKTNKCIQYFINNTELSSCTSEKDLGVIVCDNLKPSKHIDEVVLKANRILGLINRTVESKYKETVLPLYLQLVRPHLEYCVQAWRPYCKKDIEKLERVQKRAVRMIRNLKGTTYVEKLKELNLFSLEKRRLRGDLIETFKILKGINKVTPDRYFRKCALTREHRSHSLKLTADNLRTNNRKYFFSQRVVENWNRLPQQAIDCETVPAFKHSLDSYLSLLEIT